MVQKHEEKMQKESQKIQNLLSRTIFLGAPRNLSRVEYTSMVPQRMVNARLKSYTGSFYSNKLNRKVQYESALEFEFLLKLEAVNQVTFYVEQPFVIQYQHNEKSYSYYPDVFFVLNNKIGIIVEIKPLMDMALKINLNKWSALKKFCKVNGYGFLITDGRQSIQKLWNYKYQKGFAKHILQALRSSPLNWQTYNSIKEKYPVNSYDFLAIVLQHRLNWSRTPFHLSISN